MTEKEWLESADPSPMLNSLASSTSDRKFRLFGCACVRHIWHRLDDERSRSAIEVVERYADRLADHGELVRARDDAREAKNRFKWPYRPESARRAANAAQDATRDSGRSAARNCVWEASRAMCDYDTNHCDEQELEYQTVLVRDIFGNPLRPVTFDASWRTPTVAALALSIYDTRNFDRIAELGESLAQAGCHDEAILNHCQQSTEHVRGCWVVDLVLGRE